MRTPFDGCALTRVCRLQNAWYCNKLWFPWVSVMEKLLEELPCYLQLGPVLDSDSVKHPDTRSLSFLQWKCLLASCKHRFHGFHGLVVTGSSAAVWAGFQCWFEIWTSQNTQGIQVGWGCTDRWGTLPPYGSLQVGEAVLSQESKDVLLLVHPCKIVFIIHAPLNSIFIVHASLKGVSIAHASLKGVFIIHAPLKCFYYPCIPERCFQYPYIPERCFHSPCIPERYFHYPCTSEMCFHSPSTPTQPHFAFPPLSLILVISFSAKANPPSEYSALEMSVLPSSSWVKTPERTLLLTPLRCLGLSLGSAGAQPGLG